LEQRWVSTTHTRTKLQLTMKNNKLITETLMSITFLTLLTLLLWITLIIIG